MYICTCGNDKDAETVKKYGLCRVCLDDFYAWVANKCPENEPESVKNIKKHIYFSGLRK